MSQEETLADDLLPSLIQCFGIIAIGYIFGQLQILESKNAKGICIFLQCLSLPSLIFTSLATISFTNVNWQFLASILFAKAFVFIIVVISTMLLTKPIHLGKSGIYAIAATQSNDFALGYPLMTSLYKTYNKNYPLVLYLIVPIQLLLLNPTGFFLLEMYKEVYDPECSHKNKLFSIGKKLLKNPIILATVLGMIYNVAFNHQNIPSSADKLLESLSSVFSTLALFSLGHGISSEGREQAPNHSIAPGCITMFKLLVLPLLLQKTVYHFLSGTINSDIKSLSHLAFLYGVIPTAPSAFIFAKQYKVAVNSIASTTVCSTLISAPLMFMSAALISLDHCCTVDFQHYLMQTTKFSGSLNAICCIFVLYVFIRKRQWSDICRTAVMYIIIAQIITSSSAVLLYFYDGKNMYIFYSGYILQAVGEFSTYMYAVLLSLIIFTLQWRSLCYLLRYKVQVKFYGFVIPAVFSAVLALSLIGIKSQTAIESFHLGKVQHIATFVIACISLIAIAIALVLGYRTFKEASCLEEESCAEVETQNLITKNAECCIEPSECITTISDVCESSSDTASDSSCVKPSRKCRRHYYSDMCTSSRNCSPKQQKRCCKSIEKYETIRVDNCDINNARTFTEYKKYIILLIYAGSAMLVGNALCLSEFIGVPREAFLEIQFLNVILKNGLGVVCLFIFVLDCNKFRSVFTAVQTYYYRIVNGLFS